MDLGLLSCSKTKKKYACKAYEMYSPSPLFRKSYFYATKTYDGVGILSAKYGFVLPDDHIEPYELTLKRMKKRERLKWAEKAFRQINERLNIKGLTRVFFHAGEKYREFHIQQFMARGIECTTPLEGLRFGLQLAWYDQHSTSK